MRISIRSIEIKNFRAVENVVLNFDKFKPGLYFVSGSNDAEPRLGANGAGKSTLFCESLVWGFFGRVSRSLRPGPDVERRGSRGIVSVKITFLLGDGVHTVERTRRPNNLLLDGRKVEQIEVEKLLPVNETILRKSILIDQFSRMFLDLRAEEKSQLFSEALDLDMWLRSADNAGERLRLSENNIMRQEKSRAIIQGSMNALTGEYDSTLKEEEQYEYQKRKKLDDLRSKLTVFENNVKLARQNVVDADVVKLRELSQQQKDFRSERERVARRVVECEGEIRQYRNAAQAAQGRRQAYEATKVCPECGQAISSVMAAQKASEAHETVADMHQKIEALESTSKECKAKTERIDKILRALEEKINVLHADLTRSEVTKSAYRDAESEHRYAEKELNRVQQETNPYTAKCDELITKFNELRDKKKEINKSIERELHHQAIYLFWQKGFKEIRLEQIDQVLLELEVVANQHAQSLGLLGWHIEFSTERENKSGTTTHAFSVKLFPPDEEKPISWDTYSGGEAVRWQFACTFALNEILLTRAGVDTDIEIYDEPTRHLSQGGIDDLLSCLRERAVALRRRIFFIDHYSLDHGAFDGIISVTKKPDGCVYI